jgi:hypothetical protein
VLGAALEAAEEFLRSRGEHDAHFRHLLYDFTEFLESRIRAGESRSDHESLIDGLGI